jgi:hypothetical protein
MSGMAALALPSSDEARIPSQGNMAIGFVNGFLCTSSCDVAKAKQGVDPHPKIDELQNSAKADATPTAQKTVKDTTDSGAVILDGALSATSAAAAVSPASAAQSPVAARIQAQGQIVNLLV